LKDRTSLFLLGILVLAAVLRLQSIGFGLPALNDPDELMFQMGAVRMLRGPTLNPGWFGHPATTTMYVLSLVDAAVFATGYVMGWFPSVKGFANAIYGDPTWVMLPGRVAMAVFALWAIWLVYRLGRELCDRRTGLFAALLLALSPLHIAYSQIIRSDIMAMAFVLLSLLACLRVARTGRWRDHVLAAMWLGIAMATKWPSALIGLGLVGAILLRARIICNGIAMPFPAFATLRQPMLKIAAVSVMTLGFLLLTSPYLLLDSATVIRNLHGEAQLHHIGATGGTPWQNAGWYLAGPLPRGLGWPGLLLSGWGLLLIVRREEGRAIILPVMIGLIVVTCSQRLVWDRWALPLLPLLAICAGAGLGQVCDWLDERLRHDGRLAAMAKALALVLCFVPLAWNAETESRERLNDTRQQASQWALANFGPDSSVMLEHFGFDMAAMPWRFLFPLGDAGCIDAKSMISGKAGYGVIDAARGSRSNVDYGTLAPDKRDSCRADYAILSQYDRYAAERADFPAEYEAYRALIARGRIVATFRPQPGVSSGPIMRIVQFPR